MINRFWMALGMTPVLTGVLLAACQQSQRRDPGQEALSRPVAIVNTESITVQEFHASYQEFLSRWDRFLRNDKVKNKDLRALHLERIIEGKLLDQEARRRGIEVSQKEMMLSVRRAIMPLDEPDLEQSAEMAHTTVAKWSRDYHRRLVHEKLLSREVLARIQVTDREVREHFEQHREQYATPEQVRVRHLAVGNRKTYDRVRRRLRADADFVDLVREYSITPDRLLDGDLGFVERGILPPEFDQVIFEMTRIGGINQLNRPVQTQMGFHMFRLEGRKDPQHQSLEAAAPMIRQELVREKQSAAYARWLKALRERATITIDEDLLEAELG